MGLRAQGRGFLTGSIKTPADIPEQQKSHNPRMNEENFQKVGCATKQPTHTPVHRA